MTEFYAQLGRPGRCMWWGIIFSVLFAMIAWGAGKDLMYAASFTSFVTCALGAAFAHGYGGEE